MVQTVGEKILEELKIQKKISQDDFNFVREETSLLFHMNVLNVEKVSYVLRQNITEAKKFWSDISLQFPEDKRKLFWKLFMRIYIELRQFYLRHVTIFTRLGFEEKWYNLAMMIVLSEREKNC